jgi:hypothetical protein
LGDFRANTQAGAQQLVTLEGIGKTVENWVSRAKIG